MKNNSLNSILKPYLQPAFIVCVILLAAAAAGLPLVERVFGLYLRKDPIALKKSLDSHDQGLQPAYKIVRKEQIEIEDVVKTLGTDIYIQWILEDVNVPIESPVRLCMLFITYYDMPDNVPHIPEVCYIGGGNVIKASDEMSIPIKKGDFNKTIPIKYLTFENSSGSFSINFSFPLCYLIYSNEMYANSRDMARVALNRNIFKKYSYFSKVEWKFFGSSQFSSAFYPDKKAVIQASEKLLSVILPILEKDYWPNTRSVSN